MALPVNFQDDVLASSMDGKRRYNLITNSDGTVSLEDVTTYAQEGSNFGAGQINATNQAINKINSDNLDTMEAISANTVKGKFVDALVIKALNSSVGIKTRINDGKPEWSPRGADSWSPFSKSFKKMYIYSYSNPDGNVSMGVYDFTIITSDNGYYTAATKMHFFSAGGYTMQDDENIRVYAERHYVEITPKKTNILYSIKDGQFTPLNDKFSNGGAYDSVPIIILVE